MCRMLGVVSGGPVSGEWLAAFYPLCTMGKVKSSASRGHLDGWGMAGYPNGQARYYGRSAHDASQDRAAWEDAVDEIGNHPSRILLAHFRKASVGNRAIENTHPFLKNGWSFCHNGTIFEEKKLALEKYSPAGHTDSERLFLFLLEAVEQHKDPRTALEHAIQHVREKFEYNSLTFLLTNGVSLYAYRGYSDSRLEKHETMEERDRYYTLWSADVSGTRLVCSQPILTERIPTWKPFSNGELLTI